MIDPSVLQKEENFNDLSKNALDTYQSRKGRVPLQIQDKRLFEQIFNEFKHYKYSLFKSFLMTFKSASQQVRSDFGQSEIIVRAFQSILKKHEEIWGSDPVNFDLLIDIIDVLSLLPIPNELLIKYDVYNSVKGALAKASKSVDPTFPLLGHAKKSYNKMKINWKRYISEAGMKRKASDDQSSKRQKTVAGPWTIKPTTPKDKASLDAKAEQIEEEENEYIMAPRQPLGIYKSFPKGILKSALKKETPQDQDVEMTESKKVGFNMKMNAIKRIDKVARHDKKSLYSERGEASRAMKQKIRIEWRTPRGSLILIQNWNWTVQSLKEEWKVKN